MSELHTFNQLCYPISDKPTAEEFARLPSELYRTLCKDVLSFDSIPPPDWLVSVDLKFYTQREKRTIVKQLRRMIRAYEPV